MTRCSRRGAILAAVFCGAFLCVSAPAPAQSAATQPAVKDRYSRSPGTRVKTGVGQYSAAHKQMLSLEGPTITAEETEDLADVMKVAAVEALMDLLDQLVLALQALVAAQGTTGT